MKRRIIIVAIFLLAGVFINVAVAWGCAFLGTEYETGRIEIVKAPDFYAVIVLTAFGREQVVAHPLLSEGRMSGFDGFDIEVRERAYDWSKIRASGAWFANEEATGWPQVCLRWYSRIPLWHAPRKTFGCLALGGPRRRTVHGVIIPVPEGDRSLPLIPIWRGVAVNTIFYAALLWLLILGPFALRRFIRVRRGLCPKCAYPMGESAVCSECGKALPTTRRIIV